MRSLLIFVSSVFLVAAVHGRAIIETRDDTPVKDNSTGSPSPQNGNGTFFINNDCSTPRNGGSNPDISVVPATNQTSSGTSGSQGPPPMCFNLTDPTGKQPSVIVQLNNTGSQPPSDQTSSPPSGDNTTPSSGTPQFKFCPSSGGSNPFTNGTSVNYQAAPCPGQNETTSSGPPPSGSPPGTPLPTPSGNPKF